MSDEALEEVPRSRPDLDMIVVYELNEAFEGACYEVGVRVEKVIVSHTDLHILKLYCRM